MLKLQPDDAKLFDDIMLDSETIKAKYQAFSEVIHAEQKALQERSMALWANIKAKYGLEGELRYQGGKLYPLGLGPDGAPIVPADANAADAPKANPFPPAPETKFPPFQVGTQAEPVTQGNDVPALDARKVN
jgi:hypothetical protein